MAGAGTGRVIVLAALLLAVGPPAWAIEGTAPAAPALSPLDAYAEAAATTILAEQNCPGVHLQAGRLTTLRLAAKVAPAQEPALKDKLQTRAADLRRRLATDGRDAWCGAALDAFGPQGAIARNVLIR